MFLRQLDLTTALRPSLLPDETLLFVQDAVGLYEGKYKIPNYQNGHAYLTSHRVCYVDNQEPRKFSVGIDLKDIERPEFYAGFLKSSAKITLYPKAPKHNALAIRSPKPGYSSSGSSLGSTPPSRYATPGRPSAPSPAPVRDPNATWICPICSFSNPVPSNFDPSTANDRTPLPPCLACGIKPPLVHVVKAAIAAFSNRPSGTNSFTSVPTQVTTTPLSSSPQTSQPMDVSLNQCPRCTFSNHPSLSSCEICGAKLSGPADRRSQIIESATTRPESPGPSLPNATLGDGTPESIKLSFRAGGDKIFHERLKGALVQRKWLLQNAPPIPRSHMNEANPISTYSLTDGYTPTPPPPKVVGIAGLERRGAELRKNNEFVIGSAFEDLEALMTSAKEVIAMAERFRSQNSNGDGDNDANSAEAASLLSDMGLVTTKDMLSGGSGADRTYIAELSRNLAEFLTDDKRGVLRREGGIMSLVDLWAVFNRTRNGIELVSPMDFERAATMWDTLRLPIRLRRFRSGLLVVQGRDRTDDKTVASLLSWLKDLHSIPPAMSNISEFGAVTGPSVTWDWQLFGRGVTAQETAERFGWSVGVATEELEMAEERGALCREQGLDGVRFWENFFAEIEVKVPKTKTVQQLEQAELEKRLRESGLL
ncbi:Vps36-domain-containing protein [Aureobasidium pullulans]|uniref:Vacuolar protein-sorting-associated protein 36 n=1 Tax=Aureobasidium pullulans TaxID=5580 RepID=A0A4S9F4Y5_AURPU|nr:Vps36-domain-containing protein [Aureobasidium pullulans]